MSMTKSGLACVYVFSCLGLLSCISCVWLERLYSRDIFHAEGFPQIEELFIVMVYSMVFPTRNIVNCFINFTFLTATYFSKAQCILLVL